MDFAEICEEKFDINRYLGLLCHPGCGGTSVFMGTSRCTSKISDKTVKALDYTAYVPMAVKKLKDVCVNARRTCAVGNIVVAHRVGYVPVGEPGLFVGVSAPHRQAAIQCMDLTITAIKAGVPVWKEEVYEDDTRAWTTNAECFWLPKPPTHSTDLPQK
ncbi:putative Molybdopterin synthase catalytic subunit [Hypsibius exemplaris]|uniref:Molybdopterin synthase catalytic subunit n=1 Tax=Hypsibius exemplaris TaxID=2072580 RepID=A0A1W0WC47_HYPEX|nr:putative Molybdopterin synthase catalytic subunit [Hypsibius exemplaris]